MADDMLPKDVSLASIHTMQGDLAELAHQKQPSVASLAAEREKLNVGAHPSIPIKNVVEQSLRPAQVASQVSPQPASTPAPASAIVVPPRESHVLRNLFIALLSVGVVAGSGYGILMVAKQRSEQSPVQPNTATAQNPAISTNTKPPVSNGYIAFDSSKAIEFTSQDLYGNKKDLATKIINEATNPDGNILQYDVKGVTFPLLVSALSPSVPAAYIRSISDEGYYGAVSQGNFLILKTDSYDNSFGASFAWEKTMGQDLLPLFGETAGTSTPAFKDVIIANKDARVLYDAKGRELMVWGFYNPSTIFYTKNTEVFKALNEMLIRRGL